MRPDGRRLGNGVEDRPLHVLGDRVRFVEGQVARGLRWSEISVPPSIVSTLTCGPRDQRHVERSYLRALADLSVAAVSGSTCTTTSASGSARRTASSTASAAACPCATAARERRR